jgi:hypothetical protein
MQRLRQNLKSNEEGEWGIAPMRVILDGTPSAEPHEGDHLFSALDLNAAQWDLLLSRGIKVPKEFPWPNEYCLPWH